MHIYIRALILCNKMHANYIYRQKMEDKISEYKNKEERQKYVKKKSIDNIINISSNMCG